MKKKILKISLFIISTCLLLALIFLIMPKEKDDEPVIINDSLYDYSLIRRNTFYSYEDDNYYSKIGIDISEHNQDIDFKQVKDSGIEFVYMRIGWRGYLNGQLHEDKYFKTYYKNAKENNLLVGVYFFSQAINENEAIEEAEYLLKILDDREIDLPIVYDFEYILEDEARSDNLSKEQCSKNALAFFSVLENDYDVAIYANNVLLNDYYDEVLFNDYKLWFAQYNDVPNTSYEFFIWQYTNVGKVAGILDDTDLDIMFLNK